MKVKSIDIVTGASGTDKVGLNMALPQGCVLGVQLPTFRHS